MKTTKLFFMAALALMTAACSNDDNVIQNPAQPAKAEGITITAKLAPKSSVSGTRKVTEGTDDKAGTFVAEWEENEIIAILYKVGDTQYEADATIKSVDVSGVATIEFTVNGNTTDGTPCKLVYPAVLSDGVTTVYNDDKDDAKAYGNILREQNGTISADLDIRVGAGTIQTTTLSLTVTTQPAAQYSIFKFTVQDLNSSALGVSKFEISKGVAGIVTTVTPNPAASVLYVALPNLYADTYWFSATGSDSKPYIANAAVSKAKETTVGKYYQSTVKMATVGDVIKSDGTFAKAGTSGAQAVIAYVGSVDKYFTKFLAIALEDADANEISWADALTKANEYAADHAITIGSTTYNASTTGMSYYDQVANDHETSSATASVLQQGWRLPSVTDWRYIFAGLGGLASPAPDAEGVYDEMVYGTGSTLREAINTACGNSALQSDATNNYYWSSSECSNPTTSAWTYFFCDSEFWYLDKTDVNYVRAVFAY